MDLLYIYCLLATYRFQIIFGKTKMENTASNNSNNSSSNRSIANPILNMYRESIDAWQKGYNGYNDFVQASRPQPGQTNAALDPAAAYENTSAQMKKSGEHIFCRAVEHQVELGRFFGKRKARYLDFGQVLPIASRRRT